MPLFDIFKSDKKDKDGSDEIHQTFDRLTLAPREARPMNSFVGGFDAKVNAQDGSKYAPSTPPRPRPQGGPAFPSPNYNPLPHPPAMYPYPVPGQQPATPPHSLTMQHALYNNSSPPLKNPRYSMPPMPPRRQSSNAYIPPAPIIHPQIPVVNNNNLPVPNNYRPNYPRPSSDSSLPSHPIAASLPTTPLKPPQTSTPKLPKLTPPAGRRPRASSTPPSPTTTTTPPPSTGVVQCSGVTKAGKRCTRQVKAGPALSVVHPEIDLERFCFQHTKEVMAPSGFYSHKTGSEWVKFEDWIPDYLQPDTQVALRAEMEKTRSQSDAPGYIYTFEIRDSSTPDQVHLKVGRAKNLVKRLDQWDKQCGSKDKEQVLRGWWPGTVDPEGTESGDSLMKGRIIAGEKGAWCHRLERLIHLELGDLVLYQPYLNPSFPDADARSGTASPIVSANGKKKCADCGTTHKEIFSFKRVQSGSFKDKEWESIVKPVIEKWGTFVEVHL